MSSPVKLIVVNADDYGMTESISRGILDSHINGIVSSVSIVTNTPSFNKTVTWLKDYDVDTGIHLTLNSGRPLTEPPAGIPIVNKSGEFVLSPLQAIFFYFKKSKTWSEWVHLEFKRQIETLLNKNIEISHIDSHYHIHVFPTISKIVQQLATEYNIPYIRKPTETRLGKKLKSLSHFLISALATKSLKRSMGKTIPFYGLTEAGKVELSTLKSILTRIDVQAAEIMVHPGFESPENCRYYASATDHLEIERKSVIDPEITALVSELNLEIARRGEISSISTKNGENDI